MDLVRPILCTNRLLLRRFSIADANAFYLLNNDKEVMQFTGDVPFKSIDDATEFIRNYNKAKEKNNSKFSRWTVLLKSTNEVIGWCGLKKHDNGIIDLGYRLSKAHWNNGYATEAAKACITYGFDILNIETITGRTAINNIKSIHVLKKNGMTFWKTAPCEGIENSVYYSISNTKLIS